MSDNDVVSLRKVVFPQSDPESTLKGQNALLTGASYGIGAQIAAHLAAQGINIAITARSRDKLEALARELHNRYGVTITVIPADLMRHRDRESILPAAKQGLGELDILVNNAGVLRGGPHHLRDKRDITRMFVTNCIAGAELTHDILPDMLARRSGHIVTIGSIAGMASLPYMAVYAATKGANVLFNLTLQSELQNTGVHATAVNPGFTKGDGLWDRFDLPGHPAFGETTTVDVAEKVVDALRNPGQISVISNPNDVKPVAAMWVTDPGGAQNLYNQLQVPEFMENVGRHALEMDIDDSPLEPPAPQPTPRLTR
jgi:short-subunit dehydrogenase